MAFDVSSNIDHKSQTGKTVKLLVVGVGGGGSNAVERMLEEGVAGADFLIINTDLQSLNCARCSNKLLIGESLTRGFGAGGDAGVGEKAAEESEEKIRAAIKGYDMIFLTAGMGGGTGTGATPVVARVASEEGALTLAVLTKPFGFERAKRMERAISGIEKVAQYADTVITVDNERLLDVSDAQTTLKQAFRMADGILQQGVVGISDLVFKPGVVNTDFADVTTVMRKKGYAHIGVGHATGSNKATDAAEMALSSPLLDTRLDGCGYALINICGGPEMTLQDFTTAANYITDKASRNAEIIVGTSLDDDLGDEMVITVIASGFDGVHPPKSPVPGKKTDERQMSLNIPETSYSNFSSETAHRLENESYGMGQLHLMDDKPAATPSVETEDTGYEAPGVSFYDDYYRQPEEETAPEAPTGEPREEEEDEEGGRLEIPLFLRRRKK